MARFVLPRLQERRSALVASLRPQLAHRRAPPCQHEPAADGRVRASPGAGPVRLLTFKGQSNGGRRDQRERTIPLCARPLHLNYRAAGCANEFQTFGRKPPLKFLGVGACRLG